MPEVTYRPCRRHHLSDGNAEARYCSHRPSDELNQRSCVSGLPLQKRPHEHCPDVAQTSVDAASGGKAPGGLYSACNTSASPMLGSPRARPLRNSIYAAETDVRRLRSSSARRAWRSREPCWRQPRQKAARGRTATSHWPAASSRCARVVLVISTPFLMCSGVTTRCGELTTRLHLHNETKCYVMHDDWL